MTEGRYREPGSSWWLLAVGPGLAAFGLLLEMLVGGSTVIGWSRAPDHLRAALRGSLHRPSGPKFNGPKFNG